MSESPKIDAKINVLQKLNEQASTFGRTLSFRQPLMQGPDRDTDGFTFIFNNRDFSSNQEKRYATKIVGFMKTIDSLRSDLMRNPPLGRNASEINQTVNGAIASLAEAMIAMGKVGMTEADATTFLNKLDSEPFEELYHLVSGYEKSTKDRLSQWTSDIIQMRQEASAYLFTKKKAKSHR